MTVFVSKGYETLHSCFFAMQFKNFDSLIFSCKTLDIDNILVSVQDPWSASGSSFSAILPSFSLLHHRDTSFWLKTFWL
jgi:hypothetical protein